MLYNKDIGKYWSTKEADHETGGDTGFGVCENPALCNDADLSGGLTELAAMFDVSRPTVIKALKELTNDGYIIARPHLGSFTNPAKSLEPQGMAIMPVVGVLHTDGMLTHYTPYFAFH